MDPEQTFLRVHARLSGMLSQLLTPRIRMVLEYIYLAVAVALFCLLVVMHINFVQQPGCSAELTGIKFNEAQLVQIKIVSAGLWIQNADYQNLVNFQEGSLTEGSKIPDVSGDEFTILTAKFWSNWIGSSARRSKLIFKSWKSDKEAIVTQIDNALSSAASRAVLDDKDNKAEIEELHSTSPVSVRESLKAALVHFCNRWRMHLFSFWKCTKQFFENAGHLWNTAGWKTFLDVSESLKMVRAEHFKSLAVHWLERRSKAFEPTYLYTVEKGYFLLPEGAKSQHNIRTVNVTISAQNPCFGNRFEVPALQRFMRTRGQLQLQHQAGVQITSSTIYTSTLHIARVNVRNASIGGINGVQTSGQLAPDPLLPQPANPTGSPDQPPAAGIVPDSTTNHLRFPAALNPQQAGTAPPSSSFLNPFGSFLLWILGGGASDGIVSFFSMFRDVRDPDQGQDFAAPPEAEPARRNQED